MTDVAAFVSTSNWDQPVPQHSSPARRRVIADVARRVDILSPDRLRVAVDGRTAAGKTTFAHELAAALRERGRSTARASLDDFKHPWSHAVQHGYDRTSGEGYYRNAHDLAATTALLLEPAGPRGTGRVALCSRDPLTGLDHSGAVVTLEPDTVLVVDSVFALRPALAPYWELRIWLEIAADLALERGVLRDGRREGAETARRLHEDRYAVAEEIYLAEVDPWSTADLRIDNSSFDAPRIVDASDRRDPPSGRQR